MLVKVYGSALIGMETTPLKVGVNSILYSNEPMSGLVPKSRKEHIVPIATSCINEGRNLSGSQLACTSLTAVLFKRGRDLGHTFTAWTPIDSNVIYCSGQIFTCRKKAQLAGLKI